MNLNHGPSAGDRIEAVTRRTSALLARVGGAVVLLIAFLVCGDILARNLFNRTVFHSFELSAYLFAVAVSFGMAQTLIERGHIRIDILYARMPRPIRRGLDLFALVALTATAILLAERGYRMALRSFDRELSSASSLAVPMVVPHALWALGLAVFAGIALVVTLRHAGLLLSRRGAEADRLGAISGEEVLGDDLPGSAPPSPPQEGRR